MDTIREIFCLNLRRWFEDQYPGDRTQLAAELGVSYEQICNILNGRRCGDEAWRRRTAAFAGIPYEHMIEISETAVTGGNESETPAPSRSAELLPAWLRELLPRLRHLDQNQQDKLSAWLELEGIGPPARGRLSPAGHLGGNRAGLTENQRQTKEPARVHCLEAFRHQFPRLPNTRAAVMVHDGSMIIAVNAAMCALVGAAAKEVIGTPVLDWLHPDDRDTLLARVARGDTTPLEARLLSRTGAELPVKVTMVRLAAWRGRQVRVVSMRQNGGESWRAGPSEQASPPQKHSSQRTG